MGDNSEGVGGKWSIVACWFMYMNDTNVTTIRSTTSRPAGKISRNARRDRDTIPSFARRYRARGVLELSFRISYKIIRRLSTLRLSLTHHGRLGIYLPLVRSVIGASKHPRAN